MELSELQQKILNAPSNRTVVISSAASGKTRLLTEKVRQLLRAGVNPKEIAVITFTNMAASELRQRLGEDYHDGLFVGTIHALANYFLLSNGIKTGKILDEENFDELFKLVEAHPTCVKHLEWVLLDEGQDCDNLQFKFLFKVINPDYFFVCADVKQCQPEGTKIWLRNGIIKNIEDIQIGDDIVWYEQGRCSAMNATAYNAKHKYVKQINYRNFHNDYLITVKAINGYQTKYTPNHRVFMTMKPNCEYQHTVYLMCDEQNRFRVGKIPLFGTDTKNDAPWKAKMRAEGCCAIWLLKMFKTDKEARVFEQKISYQYQIPQICWQTDKVSWTREDIDYIYEGLDTFANAEKCLRDLQLNICYPMLDIRNEWMTNQKFASNAIFQIYASNIFDNIMNCAVYDENASCKASNTTILPLISVKEYIDTPIKVYSLEVEGEAYIADGIITHNCIYQWKGSNPSLVQDLARQPDVQVFDMNENYRNGFNILSYAKKLIKPTGLTDTSIAMKRGNGSVAELPYDTATIVQKIKENPQYGTWAVLCRTNSEIATVALALKQNKIPCETFRQGDLSKDELTTKMAQNTVKLLTVHSAKGLEWDNVIVVGMRYTSDEERNICYVAATRARENLIWLYYVKKNTRKPKTYEW